ncbi:hypothetical protein O0L34_g19111 [Tuta absoluta]|nr:hypothetical protein O0L34_g19111 [Tuta absoluta]
MRASAPRVRAKGKGMGKKSTASTNAPDAASTSTTVTTFNKSSSETNRTAPYDDDASTSKGHINESATEPTMNKSSTKIIGAGPTENKELEQSVSDVDLHGANSQME